ncbi:MAG: pyroglutamyl-peptidase I [Deinococcus sp.]|nr:pyroglutamyl-peptidase I [Deinococcus sp.]
MPFLVTGFEPFGGQHHNPSQAVLGLLPSQVGSLETTSPYGPSETVTAILPVDSGGVAKELSRLYRKYKPEAALHLGLAEGRALISLERLALNLMDFSIPDNTGVVREDQTIVPGGPLALGSRLPLRRILESWQRENIPATLSNSAGTYLCNQVMYLALSSLPQEVPVGFIHLPPDETLALKKTSPYTPLAVQAQAVRLALETTLNYVADRFRRTR